MLFTLKCLIHIVLVWRIMCMCNISTWMAVLVSVQCNSNLNFRKQNSNWIRITAVTAGYHVIDKTNWTIEFNCSFLVSYRFLYFLLSHHSFVICTNYNIYLGSMHAVHSLWLTDFTARLKRGIYIIYKAITIDIFQAVC